MSRLYVERSDREMDLLLRLDGSASDAPRTLTIIATVFKKSCEEDDWRCVCVPLAEQMQTARS